MVHSIEERGDAAGYAARAKVDQIAEMAISVLELELNRKLTPVEIDDFYKGFYNGLY